jgi:hypothetical protein
MLPQSLFLKPDCKGSGCFSLLQAFKTIYFKFIFFLFLLSFPSNYSLKEVAESKDKSFKKEAPAPLFQ